MTKQEQLQTILYEMFQMDNSDLDFGIYRIMNMKNKDISDFFDKMLFAGDLSPEDEDIIYSDMVEFFSRYYQNGDFVSQRRYSSGSTYSIPYNGEEVKLHWANADQYYIKTSEDFKDYTFKTPFATISFKIKEAETDSNNNKSEKRFFVFIDLIEEDNHLILNFEYKSDSRKGQNLQNKINNESFESIKEKINISKYGLSAMEDYGKDKKKTRSLLEKHLTRYTAKNSFDYFIHKDLGKFLRQELDNFIKNELINLDEILESINEVKQTKFERVKTFKCLSLDVITFLAQLEDFQKQLWEKKKFIIETNYCITLDKIDEQYYEKIFTTQKALQDKQIELPEYQKENQLDEWKKLFDINITSVKELKSEPFLVLDTKFFSTDFKYQLLAEFDNLDEELDGVLINSENFGALNLLQDRYKEQVKCVYIDPPYNTGGDDFIYKDNYQHSSWLSMMNNRLNIGSKFIKSSGQFSISIDLKEQDKTVSLLDTLWGEENRKNFITIKRGSVTGAKVINPGVVNISEYVLTYSVNTKDWEPERAYRQKMYDSRYGSMIVNPDEHYSAWIFQSVLDGFSEYKGLNKSKLKKELGENYDDELTMFVIENAKRVIRLASLDEKSVSQDAVKLKRKSLREKDTIQYFERPEKNDYYILNGNIILFYKDRLKLIGDQLVPSEPISDIWDDVLPNDLHNEGGVSLRKGKKPEKLIHRIIEMSSREKELVMDYFAGSGTTCAVAQKSNRKWLGVEQGKYFNTITLVRMKNTLYGDSSGVTNITAWQGGGFFKYFKLESYEDTLNNLTIKSKENIPSLFKDKYLLNYILSDETKKSQLDIDKFKNPFDYKLKISSGIVGATKEVNVDLVETFNYLIGLQIENIKSEEGLIVVTGSTLHDEKIMVLWRDENIDIPNKVQEQFTEYDKVYINGDVDIDAENIFLTEKTFYKQMFKGV